MWRCAVCDKEIYPDPNNHGEPESRYWKGQPTVVRNRVVTLFVVERAYCSCECGLKDYEEENGAPR